MDMINQVASYYRVHKKFISSFDREDPFNGNRVEGYICRKKGIYGGSICITRVNGVNTAPQYVVGTPKLYYPYKNMDSTEYKDFKGVSHFKIAEKWNGMNILFYSYLDANGNAFFTAKSKGTPFVSDGQFGDFFTLTSQVVGPEIKQFKPIEDLVNGECVGISFELCGRKEPHLVAYNFDIDLKPLFKIYYSGYGTKIAPYFSGFLREFKGSDHLIAACEGVQHLDRKLNDKYREACGLEIKYEYNHFATEGKVLYLLDENGYVIDNMLYKIKPSDIFSVHTASFDDAMRQRVKEAYEKIILRELELTEGNIQDELDMGPKEWSRWKRQAMKYIETL